MMIIGMKGIQSLRQLRRDLQDEAGLSFPQAVHIELLALVSPKRTKSKQKTDRIRILLSRTKRGGQAAHLDAC